MLCHLSFRWNISATIAPNRIRLEPLESRHPNLFRDIKNEENRVSEYLQIATQRLDPKEEGKGGEGGDQERCRIL